MDIKVKAMAASVCLGNSYTCIGCNRLIGTAETKLNLIYRIKVFDMDREEKGGNLVYETGKNYCKHCAYRLDRRELFGEEIKEYREKKVAETL